MTCLSVCFMSATISIHLTDYSWCIGVRMSGFGYFQHNIYTYSMSNFDICMYCIVYESWGMNDSFAYVFLLFPFQSVCRRNSFFLLKKRREFITFNLMMTWHISMSDIALLLCVLEHTFFDDYYYMTPWRASNWLNDCNDHDDPYFYYLFFVSVWTR